MKSIVSLQRLHLIAAALLTVNFVGQALRAEPIETKPFNGITVLSQTLESPRLISLQLVSIDLLAPGIRLLVSDGRRTTDGPVIRETTRQFVEQTGAQIGINGGFFAQSSWTDILSGQTRLLSLSVSDGKRISPWHPTSAGHNHGINISKDNEVTFIEPPAGDHDGYATAPDVTLYNAIAGNVRLIRAGKIVARAGGDSNYPQSCIGLTADHRLLLFVSDGRQPELSVGMTYREVAEFLAAHGAVDAIALDGGGSATLVLADTPDGRPRVVNHPSDGMERPVGNSIAVFASRHSSETATETALSP